MVADEKGAVRQFADHARRRGQLYLVDGIAGLGRGHVVGRGAHAADALGDARHLFDRPPLAKGLKAAKLGHLKIGVGYVTLVIDENGDLAVAFQPCDGVDIDSLHSPTSRPLWSPACDAHTRPTLLSSVLIRCRNEEARLKR